MSCHIALEVSQLPFELVYVGKNADESVKKGFKQINPLGAVPALSIDNQQILTQNIAILEYIADQKPESKLLAPAGTFERAETMMWLSLVATDLHKSFGPLFGLAGISADARVQEDIKKWSLTNIDKYLTRIDAHLKGKTFLVGEHLSIADCYLFTVYQWTKPLVIPTDKYAELNRYSAMLAKIPAIIAVHERENVAQTQTS